jgi:glycosyltransferase involved in cell wall biosynthesis
MQAILSLVVDGQIHLNESTKSELNSARTAVLRTNHGTFDYPVDIDLDVLSPPQFQFGFIGNVAAYKGVLELVRTLRMMPDPEYSLLIAGKCQERSLHETLLTNAKKDQRINYAEGWLSEKDLVRNLLSCETVVIPYRQIHNSGSAILAIELRRRVVMPAVAAALELKSQVGEGWVDTYEGELEEETLRYAVRPLPPTPPCLKPFAWDTIAQQTAAFYANLTQPKHHGSQR